MEIACCYRLIPHGEVIHSTFDDVTKVIAGLPEEFYDVRTLGIPIYTGDFYRHTNRNFKAYVEAMLLSNPMNAIAIEFINGYCYLATFDGYADRLQTGLEYNLDDFEHGAGIVPDNSNYIGVGFRVTKMNQFRFTDTLYRLTYNRATNRFHTNDGILVPEFDVSTLSELSYNYAGYKDCVNNGHYAVVYQGGTPTFLDRTPDNKLIIYKED